MRSIKGSDGRTCLLSDLCTQLLVPALQSMSHLQRELFKMTQHSFVMATGTLKAVIRKFEEDTVMVLKEMQGNKNFTYCSSGDENGKSSAASYSRAGLGARSMYSVASKSKLRQSSSSLENDSAKYVVVDHDFAARDFGELSIMEGQGVELICKAGSDDHDDWWEGRLPDGKGGLLPLQSRHNDSLLRTNKLAQVH